MRVSPVPNDQPHHDKAPENLDHGLQRPSDDYAGSDPEDEGQRGIGVRDEVALVERLQGRHADWLRGADYQVTMRLRMPLTSMRASRRAALGLRRGAPAQSAWFTTLKTFPSGARTKNGRTPHGSVVSGCTIS
jgi:hypothetical protein